MDRRQTRISPPEGIIPVMLPSPLRTRSWNGICLSAVAVLSALPLVFGGAGGFLFAKELSKPKKQVAGAEVMRFFCNYPKADSGRLSDRAPLVLAPAQRTSPVFSATLKNLTVSCSYPRDRAGDRRGRIVTPRLFRSPLSSPAQRRHWSGDQVGSAFVLTACVAQPLCLGCHGAGYVCGNPCLVPGCW